MLCVYHFIKFSQLSCEVCIVFTFRVEELDCQSQLWHMEYDLVSLGCCGAYWVVYNRMGQATKVLILCAEMEQTAAGVKMLRGLMSGTQFSNLTWFSQGPRMMGLKERENLQSCFSYNKRPLVDEGKWDPIYGDGRELTLGGEYTMWYIMYYRIVHLKSM